MTGLGHCHPRLADVITRQALKLWHVSNAFGIPEQEALAERLCAATFADRVFFSNSGAEALETAIKTAHRYHFVNGNPQRYRLLTFQGDFHGRTLATVAAGGQPKYLEGFGPPAPGFDSVPFGDIAALEAACTDDTAAVPIEPIQGKSGVHALSPADLARIRALCDRKGLLLIFDEVQTGVGRTGHLFAYQASGTTPDILASAKGLGNGFPVAACLAIEGVAPGMTPGTHGSTFGGNPLAMTIASEVLDIILADGFLDQVRANSVLLRNGLEELAADYPAVIESVRGVGFLLGLKCALPHREVADAALGHGLLTILAGDNVLRVLPPINIERSDIDEGLRRLRMTAHTLSADNDVKAQGSSA
ncbi:MAG: Acetylornithine aminotransferase [Rhizobium sp.]|nr:Acetylornithine aminotransferase [Rhizobium sp.]